MSNPHSIPSADDDGVPGIRKATRDNFEYLVGTLSKRTAGKKYENFVVNQIWNLLADPTIRPVTQQYVNRRVQHQGLGLVNFERERAQKEDANHALIDLYFPALRLGVECDEAQHGEHVEDDKRRTADVERAIDGYEEHRIRVEKDEHGDAVSPEAVLVRIDEVVARIRQRKAEVAAETYSWAPRGFAAWMSERPDWKSALAQGSVSAGDGFMYSHNGHVKELFGLGNGEGTLRNPFRRNFNPRISGHVVWIPSLAKRTKEGKYRSTNNGGFLNRVFVDGDDVLIGQANPTEESVQARLLAKEQKVSPPPWEYADADAELAREADLRVGRQEWDPTSTGWAGARRITFVSTRDEVGRVGIQFLGVFSPPLGWRVFEGKLYRVCRLESDSYRLPDQASSIA